MDKTQEKIKKFLDKEQLTQGPDGDWRVPTTPNYGRRLNYDAWKYINFLKGLIDG